MLTMMAARNWGLFVLRGVLALLIGVLAFIRPDATLAALIFVFGVYAILDGVGAIAAGWSARGGARWWIVVAGVAAILLGAYAFINPTITALALVTVIGAFSIIRGAAEIATAIRLRNVIEGEWLYIASGVVGIIFGGFIIASPGEGALALLWLFGFYALFAGIMYLALGWRLRVMAGPAR